MLPESQLRFTAAARTISLRSGLRRSAVLAAFVAAACSDLTGPGETASVLWIEAAWLGDTLAIRVKGTAGCSGLSGISLERSAVSQETDVIVHARARPRDRDCILPASFDTTLELTRLWTGTAVNVWSPFRTMTGGEVTLDTLPDGCWVYRTPRYAQPQRVFAYDSIHSSGFPKYRERGAFVRAVIESRLRCDSLPVLEVASIDRDF
jgi:hypothetical protein